MRKTKGEKTREFILDCAAEVIAVEGVHRMNLARIAKRAKTVPSHISHYFPKKDDLFLEVIQHIFAKLFTDVQATKAKIEPETRLLEAIRENYRYFQKHPHQYSVLVLGYYYASIYPELKTFLGRVYQTNVQNALGVLTELNERSGAKRSEEELRRLAESFVFDLEGGLIYFFLAHHEQDSNEFIENHIASQSLKLQNMFERGSGNQ